MLETHSQSTRSAINAALARRQTLRAANRARALLGSFLLVVSVVTPARTQDGLPLPPESSRRTAAPAPAPAQAAPLSPSRDPRTMHLNVAADWRKTLHDRWNGLPPETAQRMLVLGAIFLGLVVIQRLWTQRSRAGLPAGAVQVCGRVPLSPKQFVHLVRVGERLLVLLESPQGTQRIAEITDPAEVERLLQSTRDPNPVPSRAATQMPAWEASTPRVSQVLAQFRDWEQRGSV